MKATGKIIVCAYPDTFVKFSDEWFSKILPYLGLGTSKYIKAGHSALILIENKTGRAYYFDFGRYITPLGHGRVRGAETDVELNTKFDAQITSSNKLENLDDFLIWLSTNPQKTHGEGKLIASLCESVDFKNVLNYIKKTQRKGHIPYKAFGNKGSNCSRFVNDSVLAGIGDKKIYKALKRNKIFTPSPLGIVEKVGDGVNYKVENKSVKECSFKSYKENLFNFFDRNVKVSSHTMKNKVPENATFLDGTGSRAWFCLEAFNAKDTFIVSRYNSLGIMDFKGVFKSSRNLDLATPYKFIYNSNCLYCTIIQNDKMIVLNRIEILDLDEASSEQKSRLA